MKTKWLRPSEALSRKFYHGEFEEGSGDEDEIVLIRRLGFQVGEMGLLIGANTISELNDVPQICSIPNTADWMLGLVNLRGNLVPVFDMSMLLGIERKEKKKKMLLILGQGDEAAGILIDNLPSHQIFAETDRLENLPGLPEVIRPFIPNAYEKNSNIWFTFDHESFFQSLTSRVAN